MTADWEDEVIMLYQCLRTFDIVLKAEVSPPLYDVEEGLHVKGVSRFLKE